MSILHDKGREKQLIPRYEALTPVSRKTYGPALKSKKVIPVESWHLAVACCLANLPL